MTATAPRAAGAVPGPSAARATAGSGPVTPRYRLVRPDSHLVAGTPTAQQRAVIEHPRGRLRVLAGPGTGKTATIVEAVADRILRRGLDPSTILVLTFSRRAAAELSERIATRLDVTVTEPLVRTLHSYAYGLVRAGSVAAGEPPPRLLDAAQADLMTREILAGHADDGGAGWPVHLRAALRVPAFAAELREFMLRTAERQITPSRIAELGRRCRRPEWEAAAAFIGEYRDIADLRQAASRFGTALDQAELTVAALDRLSEPEVLGAQQSRIRRIFVDEYQDVDPAQARMVELLASGADELVVVGDPDQSIYAFRGTEPGALQRVSVDATVALTASHRMPPVLLEATRRIAGRLPGPAAHRALRPVDPAAVGGIDVRVLNSSAQEAAYVADQLRRAHVRHGVAWSRMAVLLRSPSQSADAVRRACSAAGVPVLAGIPGPLASDPVASALLMVLRAGVRPESLTATAALSLLSSPLAGLDPLAVRRLRRAVRAGTLDGGAAPGAGASADLLAEILLGSREVPAGMAPDLERPLRRLIELIALAREGADEPAGEDVLWRVWQRSGLAGRLLAACERGGRDAAHAEGMLDAAVALFGRAAELADQLPGAGLPGLLEVLGGEQLPGAVGADRLTDAVTILSAHAAKGLEWDVVAVAGVQQDTWPDLRRRASLLDLPALLDADAGARAVGPASAGLADERRLFYVAATRARRHLIVTGVQDEESAPSRFLAELAGTDDLPTGWPRDRGGAPRRALHLPALVADLRRALVADGPDTAHGGDDAAAAALALAKLAAAGVPGAHPDTWYGLAAASSDVPLVSPGTEVTLSPSQVESLLDCPLRSVLERHGARAAPGQPQLLGIAIHALAQGIASGVTDSDLMAATERFLADQDHLPPWETARLRRLLESMTQALRGWVATSAVDRRFAGSEVALDIALPERALPERALPARGGDADQPAGPETGDRPEDAHPVRLVGRVDWLSTDPQGRLLVTDFKSGATAPTRAAVAEHAQLAVYQLAAALGAFDPADPACSGPAAPGDMGGDPGHSDVTTVGGAELVYLRSGRPKTLSQPPQDAGDRARWIRRLHEVADAASGSILTARQGDACERCPVRSSCPLQPEGRQVVR